MNLARDITSCLMDFFLKSQLLIYRAPNFVLFKHCEIGICFLKKILKTNYEQNFAVGNTVQGRTRTQL